jgi:hypothetical protein
MFFPGKKINIDMVLSDEERRARHAAAVARYKKTSRAQEMRRARHNERRHTDEEFAAAERWRDRERYRRKKEREAELKQITFPFGAFVAPGIFSRGKDKEESTAAGAFEPEK